MDSRLLWSAWLFRTFALNFLGKDQVGVAYTFLKPVESEERQIGGDDTGLSLTSDFSSRPIDLVGGLSRGRSPTLAFGLIPNGKRYEYEVEAAGSPLLRIVPAFVECHITDVVERGDHAVVIGEVVGAGVRTEPEGRPDEAILWLKELGPKIFYGG